MVVDRTLAPINAPLRGENSPSLSASQYPDDEMGIVEARPGIPQSQQLPDDNEK